MCDHHQYFHLHDDDDDDDDGGGGGGGGGSGGDDDDDDDDDDAEPQHLYGAIYLFQTFKGTCSSNSHGLHICLKRCV